MQCYTFFCMQSLAVILLHNCMVLERAHVSRNSNTLRTKSSLYFSKESATPEEISIAEEHVLVTLYNGTPGESLDSLCYKCFSKIIATNTSCIHPQTLPPISAATKYHSLLGLFSNIGVER